MATAAVQAQATAGRTLTVPHVCGITVEQSQSGNPDAKAKGNVLGVSAQLIGGGGNGGDEGGEGGGSGGDGGGIGGVGGVGGEGGEGGEGGGNGGGGGDGGGGGGGGNCAVCGMHLSVAVSQLHSPLHQTAP
eukprot:scaffold24987_cov56-Phaeocystis_antarctica.AAC.1